MTQTGSLQDTFTIQLCPSCGTPMAVLATQNGKAFLGKTGPMIWCFPCGAGLFITVFEVINVRGTPVAPTVTPVIGKPECEIN